MPNDAMIQCENLTKRFGGFTAVDHVSFSVRKQSIFGFLGPNGSGKTTVIRLLCGILEPSDGQARIEPDLERRDGLLSVGWRQRSALTCAYVELVINEVGRNGLRQLVELSF